MLHRHPRLRQTGRWPVREIAARGRAWVRRWAGVALVAGLISGLGLTVAATTDLLDPPRSRAASRADERPPAPAPLPVYDRTTGAAPATRLNTPAQSALVMVRRHYELATAQQLVAETALRSYAERRRRALRDATDQTERTQAAMRREQEHRRIVALVAQQLAERLREARAAAEAETRQRRESGQEPPAGSVAADLGPTDLTATGRGAMPITSGVIGARFGAYGSWSSYHTGVDFRAGYGEPVHAAAAGTVVFAGNGGDWAGNHVAVRHADGVTTMYSHLSSIGVMVGQPVTAGQVVGLVGQTGRAFGPHLHFEVYPPGVRPGDVYRAVDPLPWLSSLGVHPG